MDYQAIIKHHSESGQFTWRPTKHGQLNVEFIDADLETGLIKVLVIGQMSVGGIPPHEIYRRV